MPDLRPRGARVSRLANLPGLQVRSDKPRGLRDTQGARFALALRHHRSCYSYGPSGRPPSDSRDANQPLFPLGESWPRQARLRAKGARLQALALCERINTTGDVTRSLRGKQGGARVPKRTSLAGGPLFPTNGSPSFGIQQRTITRSRPPRGHPRTAHTFPFALADILRARRSL